jgi:thymidine phosphorylase
LQRAIDSGAGLEKFRTMVKAQGGDLDAPRRVAPTQELLCTRGGYVTAINTEQLGRAIIELGGGRKKLGDALDFSVGLEMLVRLGDAVKTGQPLLRVFAKQDEVVRVQDDLLHAVTIADDRVDPPPLVVERITGSFP